MDISEEKLGLAIGSMTLMTGAWIATNWFPGLAPSLTTLVGGITGVFALYVGGHVTNAYLQGKNGQPELDQDVDASPWVEAHPDKDR